MMEIKNTFLEMFHEAAKAHPDKNAIVDRDGTRATTYGELDMLSARICALLLEKGVKKGDMVPICLERGMEYIAAEIGILKAGGAFIALEAEYPKARIDYICSDCGAALVIGEAFIEEARLAVPAVEVRAALDDAAFAIYTSGSTGNPKGIRHTHKSLAASVLRHTETFALSADDVQLSNGPFSFIVMLVDVYTPLSVGATVHILPEQKRRDVRALEKYVLEHRITSMFISPQMLRLFSVEGSALRLVVTGSERVSRMVGHGYRFLNLYGCSETAGVAVYFEVDKSYDNTPIGKAAPGMDAFLIKKDGSKATSGEEGELCVVGDIANEYINLPEQTGKAFQIQPDGRTLFYTNDICRMRADGSFVYVERKDWMVKVNGQRVELGEIEAVLSGVSGISEAAVKGFINAHGQTYLCAFYTAREEIEDGVLREAIAEKLPEYMVPQYFVRLEKMPQNQNGKLDRKSLKAPDESRKRQEYAAPENDVEQEVCAAFGKILGQKQVGTMDNFFEIGGDSIQTIMLTTVLEGLAVEDIYRCKTPKEIAKVWKKKEPTEIHRASDERFQHPFDEKGRMRILAGMRYYKKTQDENNMPRTAIRLQEPIDAKCLEYAAKCAFSRFRVHRFQVVGDENRLYLKENDREPVIHYNDGTRQTVGGASNNGYLTRIGYSDNEITVDMFHGINDGVGSRPFLQTLMYYYCSKKYDTQADKIKDLILMETPEDPREYADCMLFLPEENVKPKNRYVWEKAFVLPNKQMQSPWACRHYHLKVNADAADRYIRVNETSASALFTLFLSKVIADSNDTGNLPIVAAMAIDARPAYRAEATMQCCVGTLPVYYDSEIRALPMNRQLSRTREIVLEQADPLNIIASAQGTRRFNQRMEEEHPTLADKIKFCRAVNARSGSLYTYGISYIGEFRLGEGIDEHITEISAMLPANTIPVIVEILKFGGEYQITYMAHLEEDPYVHALQELFLAEGIPCSCERRADFEESVAEYEGVSARG